MLSGMTAGVNACWCIDESRGTCMHALFSSFLVKIAARPAQRLHGRTKFAMARHLHPVTLIASRSCSSPRRSRCPLTGKNNCHTTQPTNQQIDRTAERTAERPNHRPGIRELGENPAVFGKGDVRHAGKDQQSNCFRSADIHAVE